MRVAVWAWQSKWVAALCAVLAIVLAAAISVVLMGRKSAPAAPGEAGHADLCGWVAERDGAILLAEGWALRDGVSIRPYARGESLAVRAPLGPEKAMALEIALELTPEEGLSRLALETGSFYAHYRLYVNGMLHIDSHLMSGGWAAKPGYTNNSDVMIALPPGTRILSLRYEFPDLPNGRFVMGNAPRLGSVAAIAGMRDFMETMMLVLVGAMFFAASYHLVVFAVTRDQYAGLAFAVFSVLFGVRTVAIEPLGSLVVPHIGPDALWRANYALTILLGPAAYWFFQLGFPQYLTRRTGWALTAVCGTGALVCAVFSYEAGYAALKCFQIIALGIIGLILQAVIRSVWAREPGAILALAGWLCSALPAIHDILVDAKVISSINLLPFGFMAFFLCQSGVLASRIHQAFRFNESLARDLGELNEHLEQRIAERTRELSDRLNELERSRTQLEAAREAAVAASAAKSRFLANMSHELRTPLNAILGFAEIIRERMFGDGAVLRYADYAGSIHKSGSHLLRLINDILDLSKIEAGKFELRPERLDLVGEIETAIGFVSLQAQSKGVALSYSQGLRPNVLADQRAIQQILINVMSNAVKFTPAGGAVMVSLEKQGDGGLEIAVRDTGIGIAPEDMGRVLESFGQAAHDVTTKEERGTGLGLPIARGLIEAHDGALILESVLGAGTTVRIRLPKARVIQEALAAPSSTRAAIAPMWAM